MNQTKLGTSIPLVVLLCAYFSCVLVRPAFAINPRLATEEYLSPHPKYTIRFDSINYDSINYDSINYDLINYGLINYDSLNYDSPNNGGNLLNKIALKSVDPTTEPIFKDGNNSINKRAPPTPCTENSPEKLSWFDRTHLALSRGVCNQAKRFDRFFGDINYESNHATSFVRIRNNFIFERNEKSIFAFAPRVRARIYLPSAQQRFNLIISDDTEDPDAISSASETKTSDGDQKNRVSTALRWVVPYIKIVRADIDVGVRLSDGISTFVKLRSRKIFQLSSQALLKVSETVFWIDHLGFGERTQLDYERILSEKLFMRWSSAATFSQESEGIDFSQRITFYRQIDERRAISYFLGMKGSTNPYPLLENYGLGVRFRKDVYKSWLYTEVEPELLWPIEFDRAATWRLTFRLEMQLGQRPGSKN